MAKKHRSKDLFDDTTMSFGEHLEALRTHLWKAVLGIALCTVLTLTFSDRLVDIIRRPIDDALQIADVNVTDDLSNSVSFWESLKIRFGYASAPPATATAVAPPTATPPVDLETIDVKISKYGLAAALHQLNAEQFPLPEPPTADADPNAAEQTITLKLRAPQFAQFRKVVEDVKKPVVLTVQEAFMIYLKVGFVAGLVVASPWVFYQLWLFVAAGLYSHERRYVHLYLPLSVALFLGGVVFCYYAVFPFALPFLLGFAHMLEVTPQIRLSEWISFALMLPVMFGLSFQLPLVMLFMERINIFRADDYRSRRRMAILVIAIVSMILTPTTDPMSMLMMMIPLVMLYEVGILMCEYSPSATPFEAESA